MSEPHSAAYFGDQRDFWWNDDFIALMARRLGFDKVRRVLDAGCGMGHWSRVLLPHLPQAHLVGVDREERWLAEATHRAARAGLGERTEYRRADVNALPFDDASFDLVTCQTLLIHVADVPATLAEFRRVLRPGGLLLVAEPNNLATALCTGHPRRALALDERLALLRFQAVCEQGKIALGEGDNSVGDLLPGLLAAAGLREVRVWQSDRAAALVPPCEARDQQAFARDLVESLENGLFLFSRRDTERYWLAGGGEAASFDSHWARAGAALAADVEALRAGEYHCGGGNVFYLVAGRKP